MKPAKRQKPADKFAALRQPQAIRRPTFLDRLTPDQKRDLLEMRSEYRAGKLQCTIPDMHKFAATTLGVRISDKPFKNFILDDGTTYPAE